MKSSYTLAGLAAMASSVLASSSHKVTVGQKNLQYDPSSLTDVAPGDTVEFSFFPANHSVTQSSFAAPCAPLAGGGFFSGFQPTSDATGANPTTFTITVNDTNPIWVYCSQTKGNHCQSGMVFAINAATTGNKTLLAYQQAAAKTTLSTSPPFGPVGGALVLASGNSTSATGSSTVSSAGTHSTVAANSDGTCPAGYNSGSSGSSSGSGFTTYGTAGSAAATSTAASAGLVAPPTTSSGIAGSGSQTTTGTSSSTTSPAQFLGAASSVGSSAGGLALGLAVAGWVVLS
ncbi:hypothetical protein B7494_g6298 [Chlorociboria aeruginascens]|nr:hypothetical protein B7494_g6298 [Chlorociboria aeruginascens]